MCQRLPVPSLRLEMFTIPQLNLPQLVGACLKLAHTMQMLTRQ